MAKAKLPAGVLIYEGASKIDGEQIAVIVTGIGTDSRNEKTGKMAQAWIIRADIHPKEATKTGADFSICGGCKFRPTERARILAETGAKVPACYVAVEKAPANIFRTYKRGTYQAKTPAEANELLKISGKNIRIGAYGDPAAVPLWVWDELLEDMGGKTTGYTHQWQNERGRGFEKYVMASADTVAEAEQARAQGWRYFRVSQTADERLEREIRCPASKEMGFKTDCNSCKACGGHSSKARADVVIMAH